jgi:hypothetical protein
VSSDQPAPVSTHGWTENNPITVNQTDFLVQYVRLPRDNYPVEIVLTVHRMAWPYTTSVCWGVNAIPADYNLGKLPPPDQWTELFVNAGILGLGVPSFPPSLFTGIDFTVVFGSAMWDYTAFSSSDWPLVTINGLGSATSVDLYDVNGTKVDTSTVSAGSATLWCGSSRESFGAFPFEGYLVVTFPTGKQRSDARDFFAGDSYSWISEPWYSNECVPSVYRHLPLGAFEKKGSDYANDYMYSFMRYGQQYDSQWVAFTRLTETKVKHGNSWLFADNVYLTSSGQYYQLDYSTDPCGLITRCLYWDYPGTAGDYAYIREVQQYGTSGGPVISTEEYWDLTKDLIVASVDPNGGWTTYSYDVIGRITRVVSPGVGGANSTRVYVYPDSNTIWIRDENGHWSRIHLDLYGATWWTQQLDDNNNSYSEVLYTYAWDYQVVVEDLWGLGVGDYFLKTYFDSVGRVVRTETPDCEWTTYQYDDVNRTVRAVDATGRMKVESFDIAGRLNHTWETGPAGQIAESWCSYDEKGNLIQVIQNLIR